MGEVLTVIMRWLHISAVATLVGGVLYGRLVMVPACGVLPADARDRLAEKAASLFRPFVFTAMSLLVVSGLYSILTHPGHRPIHNVLLAVKLLLVAHVFAAVILMLRPQNPRRVRLMTSIAVSGLMIIAISACLRAIY